MNFEAGMLLVCGGFLLIIVLLAVGRVIGRGSFVRGVLIPLLLFGIIIYVGSSYLDRNGEITTGVITQKQEQIRTDSTGSWYRRLELDVEFTPRGATLSSTVRLSVEPLLFDQLKTGDSTEVRYIYPSEMFLFSRLAKQSTLSMIPWRELWPGFLIASLIGLIALWFYKPRRQLTVESEPAEQRAILRPLAVALLGVWLVAVNLTVFQPILTPVSGEGWRSGMATVRDVRRYTEVTESTRTSRTVDIVQPFDIVQFVYVPQGTRDTVIGVDVVDTTDSASRPELGSQLSITYPLDNPRAAAIVGAARTHYWKNPLAAIGVVVGSLLGLGLLWLALRWIGRSFWAALKRR